MSCGHGATLKVESEQGIGEKEAWRVMEDVPHVTCAGWGRAVAKFKGSKDDLEDVMLKLRRGLVEVVLVTKELMYKCEAWGGRGGLWAKSSESMTCAVIMLCVQEDTSPENHQVPSGDL